jgi:nucleotide-binding universal stress UspA family protein
MEREHSTLKRILVPVDFSPCSQAAIDYAALLAERFGASIEVLHVWHPPRAAEDDDTPLTRFAQSDAGEAMTRFLAELEARGVPEARGRLERGAPAEAILDVACIDHCDLIVLGAHGKRGLSHLITGSVAAKVVRGASCPVLTVHATTTAGRPS